MKYLTKMSMFLAILICGLLLFTACGGSGSTDTSADTETDTESTIADDLTADVDNMKTDFDMMKDKVETATDKDAADLANSFKRLENHIDDKIKIVDAEFKDGTITEDVKNDLDSELNTLKEDTTKAVDDLKTKAGDAASTIKDDAKDAKFGLKTKEDFDNFMSSADYEVSRMESEAATAGDETKAAFKEYADDLKADVDDAKTKLDSLVADSEITEDEKTTYDADLKDLEDRIDTLKTDLDK